MNIDVEIFLNSKSNYVFYLHLISPASKMIKFEIKLVLI